MTMKHLVLLCMALLLTSCVSPEIATPAPTPQAINIYYPASLQPWSDKLAACAINIPGIALYFYQSAKLSTPINPEEIVLEFGQLPQENAAPYVSQVGWEQVVVIVNQTNPISQLTAEELKQVFSGQLTSWVSEAGRMIQVWVLPESEPTRHIFDNALRLKQLLASDAMLAPDPQALLEAVSSDEAAIGYLPQSFVNSNTILGGNKVKILHLEDSLMQELNQPVLVMTQSEPSGNGRNLLLCLQDSRSH